MIEVEVKIPIENIEKIKQMPIAAKNERFTAFSFGQVLRISLSNHVFI